MIVRYKNCRILRNRKLQKVDLWTKGGNIIDPIMILYREKRTADVEVDCQSGIISPGFIDVQINGAVQVDFSMEYEDYEEKLGKVARHLLGHGVTSFCPTLVSSSPQTYKHIIPKIQRKNGGQMGAGILGIHLEGPFIARNKIGTHCAEFVPERADLRTVTDFYGEDLSNVAIVTMAPEVVASDVVDYFVDRGIVVSIGHTSSVMDEAVLFVERGASFITHLYNAMSSFHHREPGPVGLLSYSGKKIFYGIIADGIHVHPASVEIAYSANPGGLVLITDAMSAMGSPEGIHKIGTVEVEVKADSVTMCGTETLAGSVITIPKSIRNLINKSGLTVAEALVTATENPAELLGIRNRKGTLDFETDADFVILSAELEPLVTVISGRPVWKSSSCDIDMTELS